MTKKENRRTRLIKRLMKLEGVSTEEFAKKLGTNPAGLYLKNAKNRYSIDDMMKLLNMRGFRLLIEDEFYNIHGTIRPEFFIDDEEQAMGEMEKWYS